VEKVVGSVEVEKKGTPPWNLFQEEEEDEEREGKVEKPVAFQEILSLLDREQYFTTNWVLTPAQPFKILTPDRKGFLPSSTFLV